MSPVRATFLSRGRLDRGGVLPFIDGAAYQVSEWVDRSNLRIASTPAGPGSTRIVRNTPNHHR